MFSFCVIFAVRKVRSGPMNEPLVSHWRETLSLSEQDQRVLREFSVYMSRPCFLIRKVEEKEDQHRVCFSDEACRLWMTLEEMGELLKEMKQGRPVPWENLMERVEPSDRF